MKALSSITIYEPGIVLFDPINLKRYLKSVEFHSKNVFDFFIANELIGRNAVEKGIVFPLYEIPERDYSIFIETPNNNPNQAGVARFTYRNLPLEITSGLLITADLSALFDWDEDLFTHYIERYDNKLDNSDYLEVAPGIYQMDITGYSDLKNTPTSYGYGIQLTPTDSQKFLIKKSIGEFNFSIE